MTARALAEEFEVSERTIHRDIDALSAAGIPVFGDRGHGGGFALLDGYRTRLTGLFGEEAEALTLVGLPGPAAALGLGQASSRARSKLLAALDPPGQAGAGRLAARFHVDPTGWYQREEDTRHLPVLARAVLDSRIVSFRYESWQSVRDWRIEPHGLVLKGGNWYCVGRSGGRMTTFRVAAMVTCTVEAESFVPVAGFDLAAQWSAALERFEAALRPRTATLRTTPQGRRWLAELGDFAARAVAGKRGVAEVALPVENDAVAARQLVGLGSDVEVLAPESLRRAIAALATRVAAAHAGPGAGEGLSPP